MLGHRLFNQYPQIMVAGIHHHRRRFEEECRFQLFQHDDTHPSLLSPARARPTVTRPASSSHILNRKNTTLVAKSTAKMKLDDKNPVCRQKKYPTPSVIAVLHLDVMSPLPEARTISHTYIIPTGRLPQFLRASALPFHIPLRNRHSPYSFFHPRTFRERRAFR